VVELDCSTSEKETQLEHLQDLMKVFFAQPKLLPTYREHQAKVKHAWIESVFIDKTNDLGAAIGTTYTTLSKVYTPVTEKGNGTIDVVSHIGFTGDMNTLYEVRLTSGGGVGTAKFIWRKKTFFQDVWSSYSEEATTGANCLLADGVSVDFTNIDGATNDVYLVQACGAWHTPASGYRSYLTSIHVRLYDVQKAAKAAKARVWSGNWRMWDLYDTEVNFADWRTPVVLEGDGSLQFKVEVAEASEGDIEFFNLTLKGWDEEM